MNGRKTKVLQWLSKTTSVLAAGLMAGTLAPTSGWALPQGGTVAAGSASVTLPSSTSLKVNQFTDRLVMDWLSFNIAGNESVRFQQPGVSSIALNRVASQEPSAIFGSLSANGQIFLVNPSGILFGSSSRVDVGALTASTLNITNQDFLNSNYRFTQVPGYANAAVINQGTITAGPGGFVALLGAAARNEGVIQANLGSIVLASGKAATLDVRGDGLIDFLVTAPVVGPVTGPDGVSLTSYVSNIGTLQADGGRVILTAQAAVDVIQSVVNQRGIIRARTMEEHAGEIVFSGGEEGIVTVSGTVDAAGGGVNQMGGTIHVLGDKVGLVGATINVSGEAGGGTLLVGGDVHGQGTVQNATQTYVSPDSVLNADAINSGNGGKVIVWADSQTSFYGSISARGGAQSGNGGFVEVSGKQSLDFQGTVDTRAPQGQAGLLLLDPNDLTIAATADTNVTGTGLGGTPFTTTNDSAILTPTSIQNALLTGNVTIQTGAAGSNTQQGNITVNSPIIEPIGAGTHSLTLIANNNIMLNAGILMNPGAGLFLLGNGTLTSLAGIVIGLAPFDCSITNTCGPVSINLGFLTALVPQLILSSGTAITGNPELLEVLTTVTLPDTVLAAGKKTYNLVKGRSLGVGKEETEGLAAPEGPGPSDEILIK